MTKKKLLNVLSFILVLLASLCPLDIYFGVFYFFGPIGQTLSLKIIKVPMIYYVGTIGALTALSVFLMNRKKIVENPLLEVACATLFVANAFVMFLPSLSV